MRSIVNTLRIFIENLILIPKSFKRQKITTTSLLVILLLLLALLFVFMAASPMLSPFIYPLF